MSTPIFAYRVNSRMLLHLVSSNMKTPEHKPVFLKILSRCFRHIIIM